MNRTAQYKQWTLHIYFCVNINWTTINI